MRKVDLAVVGAGPAGLAAAVEASACGLSVVVLDEQPTIGGQIYRHIERVVEAAPGRTAALGDDYLRGAALAQSFRASGADYQEGSLVWHVEGSILWYLRDGRSGSLKAGRILLATGAMERPLPVPGWTLPGVMTAGAGQILLKTAGLLPGQRTVLLGNGPLLLLLAQQLLAAGGTIDAIVETVPRARYLQALCHVPAAWGSGYLPRGLRMLRALRRAGVKFYRGAQDLRIEGKEAAEAVTFRMGARMVSLAASHVFLHEGVVPNTHFTRLLGCDHLWDVGQQCFRPVTDRWGNTSVEGIMVAGDSAGILGAVAAEDAGRVAALEAAHRLGRLDSSIRDEKAHPLLRRLENQARGRRFLDNLYAPTHRVPREPDIVVCRCEEVTAGEIRSAVRIGGHGPNQMKSYLRCGMGPCQGRMCGLTVTSLIADELKLSPQEVGYFRVRPPLKPVPLQAIAEACPTEEMAEAPASGQARWG